jgi:hypothetical protein
MIIEVNLTIEQRIELIQKTNKNFDILDIGIGPVNIHEWINQNYPEIPKTAIVYINNKK